MSPHLAAWSRMLFVVAVVCSLPRMAPASLPDSPVEAFRPRPVDLDATVEEAFERLAEAGPSAFSKATAGFDSSGWFARHIENLETKWTVEAAGDTTIRAEQIGKETAGPSIARYHYLLCLPAKPVIWTLTFIRTPQRGWAIHSFRIADRLAERRDLFRDAAPAGDAGEPQQLVEAFIDSLAASDANALAMLVERICTDRGVPPENARAWVHNMSSMRAAVDWRHDHVEPVSVEAISPSLMRFTFVEYAPTNYGAWELIFYRPADRWTLQSVSFDFGPDKTLEVLFPRSSANPEPSAAAAPAPRS